MRLFDFGCPPLLLAIYSRAVNIGVVKNKVA
jgi:hypothetical protein